MVLCTHSGRVKTVSDWFTVDLSSHISHCLSAHAEKQSQG
jgi:hypothetical protein